MHLSVIIVNYNVKFFLEQCLFSVNKAISGMEAEVIVVDNDSTDQSFGYLSALFPSVLFIWNHSNVGFSRANNQAFQKATGKYVVFLNPDTIIPEDCFSKCMACMEAHPEAGALGVRMINGRGIYLKESKRGFPSGWVAFCKMIGLTKLFPRTKLFAHYYLGHLDQHVDQEVEVLSGAFMLIKKELFDRTGGFDEQFFMYGEDIDLSYRINKEGYRNYYCGQTTILHFKGESTNRDSKYVKLFYRAMFQFINKHLKRGPGGTQLRLLNAGIHMKAAVVTAFQKITHLREKKNRLSPKKSQYVFITGDSHSCNEASMLLGKQSHKIITEDKDQADEILLCEGQHFRVRNIFEFMENEPGKKYQIHMQGSQSITGNL